VAEPPGRARGHRDRFVVIGATGQLGFDLVRTFAQPGDLVGLSSRDIDILDAGRTRSTLADLRPTCVLNTAAYNLVDRAEDDRQQAFALNADAVGTLAAACQALGATFVHFSTDYVFDGSVTSPIREWDAVGPKSVYGASKLAGEREALAWMQSYVVRTSWVLGQGKNFVRAIRARAEAGGALAVVDDQRGRPTLAIDLAGALVRLWRSGRYGLWHITNTGEATWHDVAVDVVRRLGLAVEVGRLSTADLGRPAPQPGYSVLDDHLWKASGFPPLRSWRAGLDERFEEISGG